MLWTSATLAETIGVTQRHIARLVKKGIIKGQKVGHDWIILDEDAQKFIAERNAEKMPQEADQE